LLEPKNDAQRFDRCCEQLGVYGQKDQSSVMRIAVTICSPAGSPSRL
jgi:hypothetical protein